MTAFLAFHALGILWGFAGVAVVVIVGRKAGLL